MMEHDEDSLERENAAGLRLIISLLIRYPEIGSIRYLPEQRSLQLHFYISLNEAQRNGFQPAVIEKKLKEHIDAFLALNTDSYELFAIKWIELENVLQLTLERDVKSLSLHEVSMIVTLLTESLGADLITENGLITDDEDMWFQNEMLIDGLLESMRRESPRQSLVGIREEGRVMVFNQWLKKGKIK